MKGGRPEEAARIRRLRADEWASFRELRLAALRCDPAAFGSTLEREQGYPDEKWRSWAAEGAEGTENATFVAEGRDRELVGLGGVFTAEGASHVWGMWVAPGHRGRGVGGALLDELVRWAKAKSPAGSVLLQVNPDQAGAVRLYETRGFRPTGRADPLGHHPPAVAIEMRQQGYGEAG